MYDIICLLQKYNKCNFRSEKRTNIVRRIRNGVWFFFNFHFYCHVMLNIYLPFLWLLFRAILFAQPEFRPCQMLVKTFAFKRIKWCWIPLSSLFIFGSLLCVRALFGATHDRCFFWIKQLFRIGSVQFNGCCSSLWMTCSIFLSFVRACAYKWNIAFRTRSLDSFKTSDRKYVSDFYDKNGI